MGVIFRSKSCSKTRFPKLSTEAAFCSLWLHDQIVVGVNGHNLTGRLYVGRAVQFFRITVPPAPSGGKESHVLAPCAALSNFIRGTCMRDPGINRPHMCLTPENEIPDAVLPEEIRQGERRLGAEPLQLGGSFSPGRCLASLRPQASARARPCPHCAFPVVPGSLFEIIGLSRSCLA